MNQSTIVSDAYPINLLNAIADGTWEEEIPSDILGTVEYLLSELTPRERRILHLRYEQQLTLEACGKEFNVTRDRIRQIEEKALRKLRFPPRLMRLKTGIARWAWENEISAAQKATKEQIDKALETIRYVADQMAKITGEDTLYVLEAKAKDTRFQNALKTPIDLMGLSVRSYNCLLRAGIHTAEEAAKCSLLRVRNLGRKSMEEVIAKLTEMGIQYEGDKNEQ